MTQLEIMIKTVEGQIENAKEKRENLMGSIHSTMKELENNASVCEAQNLAKFATVLATVNSEIQSLQMNLQMLQNFAERASQVIGVLLSLSIKAQKR